MLQFPPPRRHDAITTHAEERRVERWLALYDDVEGWPTDRRHLVIAPKIIGRDSRSLAWGTSCPQRLAYYAKAYGWIHGFPSSMTFLCLGRPKPLILKGMYGKIIHVAPLEMEGL